jgi:hypothetical protein
MASMMPYRIVCKRFLCGKIVYTQFGMASYLPVFSMDHAASEQLVQNLCQHTDAGLDLLC